MPERAARDLAVIFDLDGTLIDSAPDIHRVAAIVLAEAGLPELSFATIRSFIGNGVGVLVSRMLAAVDPDRAAERHGPMVARFLALYEDAVQLTRPYEGVPGMLEDLAVAGHPLAICTNKPEAPARSVLRHFGWEAWFPVVIGGDSLPQRKPDPAPLHATIRALGSPGAVFVGDSEVDAETAQAAGVPFALFTGGYRKAAVIDLGARLVFDHHATLPQLLRKAGPRA